MSNDFTHIDFHDDLLWVTEIDGVVFVFIKLICPWLGIDWSMQLRRIKRDALMGEPPTSMPSTN